MSALSWTTAPNGLPLDWRDIPLNDLLAQLGFTTAPRADSEHVATKPKHILCDGLVVFTGNAYAVTDWLDSGEAKKAREQADYQADLAVDAERERRYFGPFPGGVI